MKKIFLIIAAIAITTITKAQLVTSQAENDGMLFPNLYDHYLNRPQLGQYQQYYRLGHLEYGAFGKGNAAWIMLGKNTSAQAPNSGNQYGLSVLRNTDKFYFGLDSLAPNKSFHVIGWGDDTMPVLGDSNYAYQKSMVDRLIFRHSSYMNLSREAARITPNGFLGVGLNNAVTTTNALIEGSDPTAELHVRRNDFKSTRPSFVRFQNLPNRTCGYILMVDKFGYIYKTKTPGIVLKTRCRPAIQSANKVTSTNDEDGIEEDEAEMEADAKIEELEKRINTLEAAIAKLTKVKGN